MILKGISLEGIYKVRFSKNSITVFDNKNNKIYYQSGSLWWRKEYDAKGNLIRSEDSEGYCFLAES